MSSSKKMCLDFSVKYLPFEVQSQLAECLDVGPHSFMRFASKFGRSVLQSQLIITRAQNNYQVANSPTILLLKELWEEGRTVRDVQKALEEMDIAAADVIPENLDAIYGFYYMHVATRVPPPPNGNYHPGVMDREPSVCNCQECHRDISMSEPPVRPKVPQLSPQSPNCSCSSCHSPVPYMGNQVPRRMEPGVHHDIPIPSRISPPRNRRVDSWVLGQDPRYDQNGHILRVETCVPFQARGCNQTGIRTIGYNNVNEKEINGPYIMPLPGNRSHRPNILPVVDEQNCTTNIVRQNSRSNVPLSQTSPRVYSRQDSSCSDDCNCVGSPDRSIDFNRGVTGTGPCDSDVRYRMHKGEQGALHFIPDSDSPDMKRTISKNKNLQPRRVVSAEGCVEWEPPEELDDSETGPNPPSRTGSENDLQTDEPVCPSASSALSTSDPEISEIKFGQKQASIDSLSSVRSKSEETVYDRQTGQAGPANLVCTCSPEQRTGPLVFVTYSYHDDRHIEEVIELCKFLKHSGIEVRIDMDQMAFDRIAQNRTDWIDINLSKAKYVVACISPKYKMDTQPPEDQAVPGISRLNTRYIFDRLRSEYWRNHSRNERVIPVIFKHSGASRNHAPAFMHSTIIYTHPDNKKDIRNFILKQPNGYTNLERGQR